MLSSAVRIEQHGADAVPKAERNKSWLDLFVIWAGINIALSSFLVGGLLVPGLSFSAAFWAHIIGNLLLAVLMALMGYMGVDYGISASVASRFSLGHPKGAWLSSLCIIVSLTGWFAVTAELSGLAIDELLRSFTGYSSPTLIIVLVGISNAVTAIIGFECIKWLSRLSVPFLLGLCVWLLLAIGEQYDLAELIRYEPTGEMTFTAALDLVVGALIVGVFIASDVSRYVRSRTDNWRGALAGIVPATIFLGVLGTMSKLATGDWNPVNAVQALGLGVPALVIITFSTWTTNDSNLYSAGLALTNLTPQIGRWQNTLILSLLGTVLAALRITEHFSSFLEILTYAFSPLVGIVMCDYFVLRRGRLDLGEAYRAKGLFHYSAGVNAVAWLVAIAGFFIAYYTPANFLSSLTGIGASGVLYYVGMRLFQPMHLKGDYRRSMTKSSTGT